MNIKLFVCCHKATPMIQNSTLTPIWVGGSCPTDKTCTDNTGDHISEKNPFFSELTAHYWIWKNVEADYYGIFHYRRFLDFSEKPAFPSFHTFSNKLSRRYGWDTNSIFEKCRHADIILPQRKKVSVRRPMSLYDYYAQEHHIKDLDMALAVLKEKYPEMIPTAKDVLNETTGYFCNLFIMSKPYFQAYEKWLFDILFEVEKRIDISSYDSYQRRVFGFLSERLQNIYIEHLKRHTSARIIELPLVYWEADAKTFYKRRFKYVKRRFLRLIGLYHDKNHHHR